MQENIKDLTLDDFEETKKLIEKRDKLIKERKAIKDVAIELWQMQNPEIKLMEKEYEISNLTWTYVVYRDVLVGVIEKPMDKVTSEDMKCIIEKRDNIMSYFPYNRIKEITSRRAKLNKNEIKELKGYKNYFDTYKFWQYTEPYFSQAVNTFKFVVDDENCKVFLKEDTKIKNSALNDEISNEYQKFLQKNNKISLKVTKDEKTELVGGHDCYKRDLYLNDLLIRTTYDTRKYIGFEDLNYLFNRYKAETDVYNNSIYNAKKVSLEQNIVRNERNGNFVKAFKLKGELKKLNKEHAKLNNDNEFWKNNKYIISNALLDYYNLDKNESAINKVNKEIKQIDDELSAYGKAKDSILTILNKYNLECY